MAIWVMLLGIATLVNITMVAAMISLAGNIPDASFLVIFSRYLGRKKEPPDTILYPLEAAARLEHLRRRALMAAGAVALIAAGLSIWALAVGWGTVAMLAITAWFAAGNLGFLDIPLGTWRRRASRLSEEVMEKAWELARPAEATSASTESRPAGVTEEPRQADPREEAGES